MNAMVERRKSQRTAGQPGSSTKLVSPTSYTFDAASLQVPELGIRGNGGDKADTLYRTRGYGER